LNLNEILARFPDAKQSGNGWTARCPAHDDGTASLSIAQGDDGRALLHCFANCTPEAIVAKIGLTMRDLFPPKDARNGTRPAKSKPAFDWKKCVANFTDADAQKLAAWRGLSVEFVRWLHAQDIVGIFDGKTAFANHGDGGKVASCHVRLSTDKWIFEPTGQKTAPLVFGDVKAAGHVLTFESQWDAFAVMDKFGWHAGSGLPDTAVFVTRGAGNGKLICGQVSPDAVCYAFKQNDAPTPKKPIPAGDIWLADVASYAGCTVLNVNTPTPHKDANDWTRAGATRADLEAAMKSAKPFAPISAPVENGKPCEQAADIRGEIVRILLDSKLTQTEQRTQIAVAVVKALAGRGRFFYHGERKDFDSAMYFDGERKQLLRIRADAFGAWLAEWLAVNRADGLFKFIAAQVETTALAGKQTTGILPESFWASRPGAIYLSSGDGRAVKITPGDVQLVDNGADGVLFAAGNTLAPWIITEPQSPFAACSLFSRANCAAGHGPDLLRLWLYSLPTNPASKPPLCLAGDIGSGKTRLAKGIAELYGLPFVANKAEDFGEDSFWASLDAGGLFTLDNCDSKNKWLADAVASAATDGCSQRRKLYTDADRVTLRPRAWLAMTTANPTFASDSGLADRLLLVRMNRRTDETSDASLSDEIRKHRNAGLSFIARILATALADMERTPAGLNQRHPDFAAFAVKVGRAIGREAETIHALKSAELDKSLFCLENDTIATALLAALADGQTFTGTASELRDKLIATDTDLADKLSTKRLGKRLSMLWSHLEKVLATAKQETGRGRIITYTLKIRPSGECGECQGAISTKPSLAHTQ
jgi:hypothetical protein